MQLQQLRKVVEEQWVEPVRWIEPPEHSRAGDSRRPRGLLYWRQPVVPAVTEKEPPYNAYPVLLQHVEIVGDLILEPQVLKDACVVGRPVILPPVRPEPVTHPVRRLRIVE